MTAQNLLVRIETTTGTMHDIYMTSPQLVELRQALAASQTTYIDLQLANGSTLYLYSRHVVSVTSTPHPHRPTSDVRRVTACAY
jgi:hypothetical protein